MQLKKFKCKFQEGIFNGSYESNRKLLKCLHYTYNSNKMIQETILQYKKYA